MTEKRIARVAQREENVVHFKLNNNNDDEGIDIDIVDSDGDVVCTVATIEPNDEGELVLVLLSWPGSEVATTEKRNEYGGSPTRYMRVEHAGHRGTPLT